MDNQHRKITGYRELDEHEIALVNRVKAAAETIGEIVKDMQRATPGLIDQRWVAVGATDLQKGFMALTRSITKPTSF